MSVLEVHENRVDKCVGTMAMVTRSTVAAATAVSLMMTDLTYLGPGEYVKRFIVVGNILTFQRNLCVNEMEGDWVLFIDSDMVWQPEAVRVLVETQRKFDLDIVGGLCFQRSDPYQPTMYKKAPHGEHGYTFLERWPEDSAVEVDATGMAFCLIHKRVFDRILQAKAGVGFGEFSDVVAEDGTLIKGRSGQKPAPFFRWEEEYGEDFLFCREAKSVGARVFVDTAVKVGHVGDQVITEETFLREIAHRPEAATEFRAAVLAEIGEKVMTRAEARTRIGWEE